MKQIQNKEKKDYARPEEAEWKTTIGRLKIGIKIHDMCSNTKKKKEIRLKSVYRIINF